jgi:hypothetical protein
LNLKEFLEKCDLISLGREYQLLIELGTDNFLSLDDIFHGSLCMSVLPHVRSRASKRSHTGGKCVTCCGLPFFNTAEVGITGPKWREIKTAVIWKTLNI